MLTRPLLPACRSPDQGPHFKWNLMRLYLAGLYSHYSVLGGDNKLTPEGESQKGLSENEWGVLKKYLTVCARVHARVRCHVRVSCAVLKKCFMAA